MNDVQEREVNKRRDRQVLLAVIAAFVIVVVAGVFAFLRFYDGELYYQVQQ